MSDLKKVYRTVLGDHFPDEMIITFFEQRLVYRKRVWKIAEEGSDELIEKGLRYGENPGQEAALYELVNGNLVLGDCQFLGPGHGFVSAVDESQLLQSGKHPGKTNLTDIDSALNILEYLSRQSRRGGQQAQQPIRCGPCQIPSEKRLRKHFLPTGSQPWAVA